jgi:GNAT superfamily N-acetyltransferase
MQIRKAVAADAPAACRLVRRSIIELCAADHRGDQAVLQRWLNNKTPDIVASWIARPDSTVLLGVAQEAILGVGSVTDAGEIVLNYVSPDARFRGVSKAMLAALEARAIQLANQQTTLHSTATALRLYLACGYAADGPGEHRFGSAAGYPMTKRLPVR